ncbi:hypothetical protein KY331_04640 [Candidatus Woesearchaeota archaeon]|nr:hypothetical protein [Candidatus Woesearchaeota archaeon]
MGVFSRSWKVTKLSFDVMKKDKELLLFPLLGGIFSIIFIFAMLFPTIISRMITEVTQSITFGVLEYVLLFITYLGLSFIAVFFNVCVVYTTKTRFEGGNATFFDSIKYAISKIHLIFVWSLVSATVGLILKIIERMAEKVGQGGRIILMALRSILGMIWSIVTIFVVPAMVYSNLGPIDAIKKSINTLKKTWGESIVRVIGLGLVQFLFFILGVIIIIPLFILLSALGGIGILIGIIFVIVYFIGLFLIFGVANTIFNTALYVYADQGKIPQGYDQDILSNAFRVKK